MPITASEVPRPKNKAVKVTKQKKTLALSPEEFALENLRVERDACRTKLSIQDLEMKDLKDRIKILSTRCDLCERQRNDQAFKDLPSLHLLLLLLPPRQLRPLPLRILLFFLTPLLIK